MSDDENFKIIRKTECEQSYERIKILINELKQECGKYAHNQKYTDLPEFKQLRVLVEALHLLTVD